MPRRPHKLKNPQPLRVEWQDCAWRPQIVVRRPPRLTGAALLVALGLPELAPARPERSAETYKFPIIL